MGKGGEITSMEVCGILPQILSADVDLIMWILNFAISVLMIRC
jgi:hypothetical protein